MSFDASKYTQIKWLSASALAAGQVLILTIKEASEYTFNDGSERPVISFLEIEQQLALNRTQTSSLIGMFGANAAGWALQRVELMAIPSNFQGKPTILIRAAAAPSMPSFNGVQLGQPPAAAPALSYVEPTMTGAQADDARRLWESQQQAAAPTMPQSAAGVTFR